MSFPIPYKRVKFKGFGSIKFKKGSGLNQAMTINHNDLKQLLTDGRTFRLYLSMDIIVVTAGGSTNVRVLFLKHGETTTFGMRYLVVRDGIDTDSWCPPQGDADVDTREFQGYPIPQFPNEHVHITTTAAGAGKQAVVNFYANYLEWEIL